MHTSLPGLHLIGRQASRGIKPGPPRRLTPRSCPAIDLSTARRGAAWPTAITIRACDVTTSTRFAGGKSSCNVRTARAGTAAVHPSGPIATGHRWEFRENPVRREKRSSALLVTGCEAPGRLPSPGSVRTPCNVRTRQPAPTLSNQAGRSRRGTRENPLRREKRSGASQAARCQDPGRISTFVNVRTSCTVRRRQPASATSHPAGRSRTGKRWNLVKTPCAVRTAAQPAGPAFASHPRRSDFSARTSCTVRNPVPPSAMPQPRRNPPCPTASALSGCAA